MAHGFKHIEDAHGGSSFLSESNGLKVVIVPRRSVPVVGAQITYHVGSRHESAGYTGATHILEHVMFKGSKRFDPKKGNGIWHLLEKKGAQMNATTWCDRTNYYAVVPLPLVDTVLNIEADRMRNILLKKEDLDSEMTVVRNEYERGENDPHQRLSKHAWYNAFSLHPYRIPTIGTKEDIENVSIEKLRTFYDRFYWPSNATISVVGDTDIESALKLVDTAFKELPKHDIIDPPYAKEPEQEGEKRFTLKRRGTVNALTMCFKAPPGLADDAYAAVALKSILGAGKSSLLYRALVDAGLAVDLQVDFPRFKDSSLIEIYCSLAGSVPHEKAEDAIWQVIDALKSSGPMEEDMQRAKTYATAQKAYAMSSISGILSGINEAIARGDWKDAFEYQEKLGVVNADDAKQAAVRYLTHDAATVGYLYAI